MQLKPFTDKEDTDYHQNGQPAIEPAPKPKHKWKPKPWLIGLVAVGLLGVGGLPL